MNATQWIRPWIATLLALAPALALRAASPIAPGATLKKVSGEFEFTEGPTSDRAGNVFFTDQPNDRIMKWSLDGTISTFLKPARRSNGMFFDSKGQLIACADENTELVSITPKGEISVILKSNADKALNGPNDVWVRKDGSLYFTDPFYKRPWWSYNKPPQGTEQVYFLAADRKTLRRVTDDLKQPNGIIGSANGKTLFVADIGAGKTYRYRIERDGSLADKTLFCEKGSDGMTLDKEGNLYLTGRGVMIFDKTGKQIETIPVPEPWTANVAFGGADHRTLFITASKGLYSMQMRVKGANATK